MEPTKLLLEDVQRELFDWRGTPPRRGPIPKMFWDKAKSLVDTYGLEVVARELKLNINRLSGENIERASINQPISFAEIDWNDNRKSRSYSLEFRHPNGRVVAIDVSRFDSSTISRLISDFICDK